MMNRLLRASTTAQLVNRACVVQKDGFRLLSATSIRCRLKPLLKHTPFVVSQQTVRLNSTMSAKAVVFSGVRGKPEEVLSLQDVPKPKPGPGQLLVKVKLAPVHPSVLAGITPGVYPGPAKGEAPGNEGVGVVEEVGADCPQAPAVGTRVLLAGCIGGSFAEYVLLPAAAAIPVPDGVEDHNAAQFVVNPLTALLMATRYLTPKEGEYLVQTAAASVLGKLVIQLSKLYGFKTINIVRSDKAANELKELGADVIINTSADDIGAKIKEATGGQGVKYAIDAVGGKGTSAIIQNMAYGGKLLVYGQLDNDPISFPSGLLVVKLLTIQGFWLSDWFKSAPAAEKQAAFGEMFKLFATKKLDCPVEGTYSLAEFAEAIKASVTPGRSGKVLLKIE